MKHLWKVCISVLLCIFITIPVWADEPGQQPDYYTDYYMIVESPDGGINIYSEASLDSTKLNNELIPNGTALHIEGETQEGERTWGFVQYHGMNGYVPLDDCKPSTVTEAIDSEILLEGSETVDYDVEVNAKEGYISVYRGPGEKFGKKDGVDEIPNGEKLHISEEIEVEDKSHWGLIETEDYEGWVKLEDTKKWQDKENASDMVSMSEEKAADPTATPASQEEKKVSPTPTESAVLAPTSTPSPTSTSSPTPGPTPDPTSTPSPTPAPSPSSTPEASPTSVSETDEKTETEEKSMDKEKEASSQDVKTSSGWTSNPFVWIGIISCIAVVGLLIYHFKKK